MTVERITPQEAESRLAADAGYVYVDVRTAQEFAQGHVPGAINIPLLVEGAGGSGLRPNPKFLEEAQEELAPSDHLIVGCLRGGRSLRAAGILERAGFRHVSDMRGGYDGEVDSSGRVIFPGWARLGLPTTSV